MGTKGRKPRVQAKSFTEFATALDDRREEEVNKILSPVKKSPKRKKSLEPPLTWVDPADVEISRLSRWFNLRPWAEIFPSGMRIAGLCQKVENTVALSDDLTRFVSKRMDSIIGWRTSQRDKMSFSPAGDFAVENASLNPAVVGSLFVIAVCVTTIERVISPRKPKSSLEDALERGSFFFWRTEFINYANDAENVKRILAYCNPQSGVYVLDFLPLNEVAK
jgi:hypothetical protein